LAQSDQPPGSRSAGSWTVTPCFPQVEVHNHENGAAGPGHRLAGAVGTDRGMRL